MLVKIETERMIGLSINYLHMIGYMYGELIVLWQIIAEIAAGRIIDCAELEQLKLNVFFFFGQWWCGTWRLACTVGVASFASRRTVLCQHMECVIFHFSLMRKRHYSKRHTSINCPGGHRRVDHP